MFRKIKNFFASKKNTTILHYFFGTLNFVYSDDTRKYYWSGNINYAGNSIKLRIFTDGDAPSLMQVTFFKEAMKSLQAIVEDSSRFIEKSFKIWSGKSYLDNFLIEFKCKSLDIPENGSLQNDWEITFVRKSDNNFIFTIFLEKGLVVNTDLDG